MRCISLFLVLALACAVLADEALFEAWRSQHGKTYTDAERVIRYANFMVNKNKIDANNANPHVAQMGLNFFSDLSAQEWIDTYLMKTSRIGSDNSTQSPPPSHQSKRITPPANWDWRSTGKVTAVKNQQQCGACWAFSAIEAIESAYIVAGRATATTINLSPQQLLDCESVDKACNGGNPINAYNYLKTAGVDTLASYPYKAVQGSCLSSSATIGARLTGYQSATRSGDEATLKNSLVNMGPLSICLDASAWQNYKSGVMTQAQCCPSNTCQFNHCVQLVGYNTTASPAYWILRNQWGTYWGNQGYIYLSMNSNTCGLTMQATWPTV